jgi:hypothetical protein
VPDAWLVVTPLGKLGSKNTSLPHYVHFHSVGRNTRIVNSLCPLIMIECGQRQLYIAMDVSIIRICSPLG